MRSRVAVAAKSSDGDVRDEEYAQEAAVKSSSISETTRSNETNPTAWILLLCAGIVVGVVLSSSIRTKQPPKTLQRLHKNVESAYRAHKKAKHDYLKSYRKAYLESVLASSSSSAAGTPEDIGKTNEEGKVEKPKLCWEKPDEKFCWNEGLSIQEHVDAQLHPWIIKGGITVRDVESAQKRQGGCVLIRPDGSISTDNLPYVERALNAYPRLRPKTEVCIHRGFGDWPEHPVREYVNVSDGLPMSMAGSSYEEFLEILLPWNYGNRNAFGENYEESHKSVLKTGENSPSWSEKNSTAVWRGMVGCHVGCAEKGGLYFPSNHIEQCTDDHTDGGWDANKEGRTWGCEKSKAGLRHQRIQLANMSFHHGEECGLDARITTWDYHENTLRSAGMTEEELVNLKGKGMGEKEQAAHKYIVNVQNNGFADRLWRLLALKVVVLQEMHAFREFFYDMLIPWVHYVPIKTDLSDLCEKITWLRDNDEKARNIAENAHAFVRDQLSLDKVNLYVATLIHRLGELTVQGHNITGNVN